MTAEALRKIAEISPKTRAGLDNIIDPLLVLPPISFGYLSKNAQSSYYPSDEPITRDEIAKVSEVMNKKSIGLENTRVQKVVKDGKPILQLLQASAAIGPLKDGHNELADGMFLVRGDHSKGIGKCLLRFRKGKRICRQRQANPILDTLHRLESVPSGRP